MNRAVRATLSLSMKSVADLGNEEASTRLKAVGESITTLWENAQGSLFEIGEELVGIRKNGLAEWFLKNPDKRNFTRKGQRTGWSEWYQAETPLTKVDVSRILAVFNMGNLLEAGEKLTKASTVVPDHAYVLNTTFNSSGGKDSPGKGAKAVLAHWDRAEELAGDRDVTKADLTATKPPAAKKLMTAKKAVGMLKTAMDKLTEAFDAIGTGNPQKAYELMFEDDNQAFESDLAKVVLRANALHAGLGNYGETVEAVRADLAAAITPDDDDIETIELAEAN